MTQQVPVVDYLILGDRPHLVAQKCLACGATYFDRRNACARCFAAEFGQIDVPDRGEVTTFTIVAVAAPGLPVPFVPAVIDCDGVAVRGNIVNVPADPEHVRLGMRVHLATYVIGVDEHGTQAIGFGFEPAKV